MKMTKKQEKSMKNIYVYGSDSIEKVPVANFKNFSFELAKDGCVYLLLFGYDCYFRPLLEIERNGHISTNERHSVQVNAETFLSATIYAENAEEAIDRRLREELMNFIYSYGNLTRYVDHEHSNVQIRNIDFDTKIFRLRKNFGESVVIFTIRRIDRDEIDANGINPFYQFAGKDFYEVKIERIIERSLE